MKHPTIQLLLDFAKHSVWPFYDFRDHEQMSQLINELKLGYDVPLGPDQLRDIFMQYHQRHASHCSPTEENAEKFVSLVLETRQQFGNMLTKEAIVDLNRAGHAPKQPRNSFSI